MRLPGRLPETLADPDTRLVRLLGRLAAAADGGRSSAEAGRSDATDGGLGMPIDNRSDATEGGRGIPVDSRILSRLLGVSGARSDVSPFCEPILLGGRLTLRRIVTEDGSASPSAAPARGEPFGVLLPLGAGSFDLAECTRSSIFCILPLRLLI
jgi:hypothetical protein